MTEYIEREAALEASKIVYIEYIEIDGNGYEDGGADEIPVVFRRDIETIPAADVVPVVHGRWIYKPLDKFRKYQVKCSNCDMVFIGNYDAYDEPSDFNFCPNCGARMDKEDT